MQDAYLNARHIIVLVYSGHMVYDALQEFERVEQEWQLGARVYRANGQQRVEFPRGCIDIMPVRGHRLRGRSADVVFIDNDAHRALTDSKGYTDVKAVRAFNDSVRAVIATRGGKVIHS